MEKNFFEICRSIYYFYSLNSINIKQYSKIAWSIWGYLSMKYTFQMFHPLQVPQKNKIRRYYLLLTYASLIINNLKNIINNFKDKCLFVDENTEYELILTCLNNNLDYKMIEKLHMVTYSGPQYKDHFNKIIQFF